MSKREEKFDLVLEASEDLIFILDNKGCFRRVNNNGATLLDYNPKDLIGRHFWEFVDQKSDKVIAKSFQEVLNSGELTSFEVTLTSKFGREVIFQITAKIISGEAIGSELLAVAKDITKFRYENERVNDLSIKLKEANRLISIERNRANRRNSILDELARMKNEFASNISHEFRTPLASIIGYSEAILSDPNMPKEIQTEFNNIILRESKRLAILVNNVLNLSKIEGGGIKLERSEFNIIKVLNSIIENNRQVIKEKGITLTCDIPVDEIIINGDEEKLRLVFEGLINNAIKFTDSGGRITVSAQSLYKEFEIIISDTGAGIPENDLPNIFEKFYRVRRPGKEIPGTGLGLVFVKQIIDLHKGLIKVYSDVNMGTSFVIKLPKGIKF
ncbi:MAG: PAS domain-containing sensor histidine kinase [Ignavibacteriaceae bacterium]